MSAKENILSKNFDVEYHNNGKDKNLENRNVKISGWGYRHQQCFILFWVLVVAYSMRACVGVSLVAMVRYNANSNTTGNLTEEIKEDEIDNGLMFMPPYPVFHWDKKTQDAVIASFFWGYMLLQIPAGHLIHKFGAKYLLMGAMSINCVVSIILPTITYYGRWYCMAICRVIQGLSQACVIPSLHTAIGKWAPLQERGRLSSFVHGGQALGTVFALPLTGFISDSSLGWPGVFRIFGLVSGIIALLIWFFVADCPAKHPRISDAEREYIENDLGSNEGKKKMPVPWTKILRHTGVYAAVAAHIGQGWGQLTLYSEVPAYMDKIMGVNIKANGLLTALPFLFMWFWNFFYSWLTDWLIVNNKMSVTNTRKLANSLGYIPAGMGLIALAYAPHNIYYVETLLILICSFKIASNCGFMLSEIDMAPNYAGTIISLSNFASNIGSSIGPIITGFILTDVGDKYLWRQVFFLAAGLYLVTNLIFVIFGTSEPAEWNNPSKQDEEDEENVAMMEKTVTEIEK